MHYASSECDMRAWDVDATQKELMFWALRFVSMSRHASSLHKRFSWEHGPTWVQSIWPYRNCR